MWLCKLSDILQCIEVGQAETRDLRTGIVTSGHEAPRVHWQMLSCLVYTLRSFTKMCTSGSNYNGFHKIDALLKAFTVH